MQTEDRTGWVLVVRRLADIHFYLPAWHHLQGRSRFVRRYLLDSAA